MLIRWLQHDENVPLVVNGGGTNSLITIKLAARGITELSITEYRQF
jgi:hypothetical protein